MNYSINQAIAYITRMHGRKWGLRYLVKCATSSGLLGELGKEGRKEGTGKEEKSLSNGAEAGDVLVNNACIGDSV